MTFSPHLSQDLDNYWFEAGSKRLRPVNLEGRFVRLVLLGLGHVAALSAVGTDPEIWKWNPFVSVQSEEEMRHVVEQALVEWEAGRQLPFVIEDKTAGRLLGSTRYLNPDRANLRLEIGFSWLSPSVQGTRINPEAKLLLMEYAFETLGCNRVEFKTDSLNEKSRRALLKLGAKEEGIFRNHMVTKSGRLRHSAYYSVIREEWPDVKKGLEKRLVD
jgi:RimJ/RimL family protein N-acetyltransferase